MVRIVDPQGKPIQGAVRYPRGKIFDRGVESNRHGEIFVMKPSDWSETVVFKSGYIPLVIADGDNSSTYTMLVDKSGKSWSMLDVRDLTPTP